MLEGRSGRNGDRCVTPEGVIAWRSDGNGVGKGRDGCVDDYGSHTPVPTTLERTERSTGSRTLCGRGRFCAAVPTQHLGVRLTGTSVHGRKAACDGNFWNGAESSDGAI